MPIGFQGRFLHDFEFRDASDGGLSRGERPTDSSQSKRCLNNNHREHAPWGSEPEDRRA